MNCSKSTSNYDCSRVCVLRELAHMIRFQSRLRSLYNLWRKTPSFYEDGPTEHFFFDSPELFYKQMWFERLDVVVSALKDGFEQRDHCWKANIELLLIKASSKGDYSNELQDVTEFFNNDFNKSELETHLQLLSCIDTKYWRESLTFLDICKHFRCLPNSLALLLFQVSCLVKFVHLMPCSNQFCFWKECICSAKHQDVLT